MSLSQTITGTGGAFPGEPPLPTFSPPNKVKFGNQDAFQKTLKARVEAYFAVTKKRTRDCVSMYIKTGIILSWFFGSYAYLVLGATNWWEALVSTLSLGLAMAAIGFNIQHDGNHRAYSSKPWVNRLMSMTLDMLGGSSFMWNHQHNTIHHTYCNITGQDEDINLGVLGRLSPHQKRYWFHGGQHFYLWFLYGFLPMKWQLLDDFTSLAMGRMGTHKFTRPHGRELAVFIGGKFVSFSLAFFIPLFFHPWYIVLFFYALGTWVSGLMIAVVFQLAHVVEEASFPMPDERTHRMESHWAVHQVETTVDFARSNPVLTWYLGGLNFQIEHHLLPKICHVHYPKLAKVVEETCREFGIKYRSQRFLVQGVWSHFRWLRQMGTAG